VTTPKASLIVATRNRVTQLQAGLQSIRDRAYEDVEMILVDDGSTDGSEGVIESYAGMFSTIIRIPPRTSGYSWNPSSVLNAGHRAASSDIHMEQGGEVCHLTDCITPLIEECRPGVVALARCYHGPASDMETLKLALAQGRVDLPPTVRPELCRTEAGVWMAALVEPGGIALYSGVERLAPFMFLGAIHREDFEAVGGYDEKRKDRNDTDLANRLQARGVRFSFVGTAVAFHLQHAKA